MYGVLDVCKVISELKKLSNVEVVIRFVCHSTHSRRPAFWARPAGDGLRLPKIDFLGAKKRAGGVIVLES